MTQAFEGIDRNRHPEPARSAVPRDSADRVNAMYGSETQRRPGARALARLRGLHDAAVRLAARAPETIANPGAARGLEQALIGAMAGCLADRPEEKISLAKARHAAVMRRFWQAVEESEGQPLYVPEMCKTVQVSERTLRACCHEHLGMSPKRYLLLRRTALARRSLCEEAAEATSVTDIAMRYGFWDLGRFAVEYKALFSESPSATLRQPKAAARVSEPASPVRV